MIKPKYIWKEREYEEGQVNLISEKYSISRITSKLLVNRGIVTDEEIKRFLNPTLEHFYDPFLLKGMNLAVDRIIKALKENEKVFIYGDFDVDGITSTSIMYMFLKEIGIDANYYIPNRLEEGYGVNKQAIEHLNSLKTNLIITVDTGITAIDEVKICNELGMDIIITDHHEPQESIPDALCVIDPKLSDANYPFDQLAGVGVAFKLIHGLAIKLNVVESIWKYLDIVAIGTVADIVPLVNENRIIVKHAFTTIPNTWNLGLKHLLNVSGYHTGQEITSGIIGFRVAPRLNAAGRLGDALRGVKLFITKDEEEAKNIADDLNNENLKRQALEQSIFDEAVNIIETTIDLDNTKIIVVVGGGWHHGVLGIVSSRITEKYYRPSIVLCIEDGVASGSARSVEGFSIFDALCSCKHLMNKFGGHEMAAGLSLKLENVELLSEQLNDYAKINMDDNTLTPKIYLDGEILDTNIDLNLLDDIDILRPYGMGNPEPLFKVTSHISYPKTIGKENNHLKLQLGQNKVDVVGFGMGVYCDNLYNNACCSIVAKLDKNEWNGITKPQLFLKDISLIEEDYANSIPSREDLVIVYKLLVNYSKIYGCTITKEILINRIKDSYNLTFSKKLIENCLEVFNELQIVTYVNRNNVIDFNIHYGKKVDLYSSTIYRQLQENASNF